MQAHCDWLLFADPASLPGAEGEGRALHVYLDPKVVTLAAGRWGLTADDPERIGSAAWQGAQVAANREDPTYEWALILKAYDRAEAAYRDTPALLNQALRVQQAMVAAADALGLIPIPPPHPGLGLETHATIASNRKRGAQEMLVPLFQLTEQLFAEVSRLLYPEIGAAVEQEPETGAPWQQFTQELTFDQAPGLAGCSALCKAKQQETADPLVQLTLDCIGLACGAAAEFHWALYLEGPEEEPEWSLGNGEEE